MSQEDTKLCLVYKNWLEHGWGDRTLLPLNIIFCIHDYKTLDGIEDIPDWAFDKVKNLVKTYREKKKFIVINSNGENDYSYYIETVSQLFTEYEIL